MLALDLPETHFDEGLRQTIVKLRMAHDPSQEPTGNGSGPAPDTDTGLMTPWAPIKCPGCRSDAGSARYRSRAHSASGGDVAGAPGDDPCSGEAPST